MPSLVGLILVTLKTSEKSLKLGKLVPEYQRMFTNPRKVYLVLVVEKVVVIVPEEGILY